MASSNSIRQFFVWVSKSIGIFQYISLALLAAYYAYPIWFGVFSAFGFGSSELNSSFTIMGVADPQIEGNHKIEANGFFKGTLDVFGNDLYLRHLVQINKFWGKPEAMVLLGDLVSFQNLDVDEFKIRVERLKRITGAATFNITETAASSPQVNEIPVWTIPGNHDIGYGNDLSELQTEKWTSSFGPLNWVTEASVAGHPVRILGINSLALDDVQFYPEMASKFQSCDSLSCSGILPLTREAVDVWTFLYEQAAQPEIPTIVFTHIPFYKPEHACVDNPFISRSESHRVLLQNHISYEATQQVFHLLPGIALILSGHDHMGCDYHYPNGVIEHTLPSVMGYFGGNIGFVELTLRDIPSTFRRNLQSKFHHYLSFLPFSAKDYVFSETKAFGPFLDMTFTRTFAGPSYIWWALHIFTCVLTVLRLLLISFI
ncbi:GPI-remodelling mannose-ethanolamine phosphate phosphodiesterase Ted1 [Schizosaccharomyces osmophilus]|uniref:GPI-remodelling mannose-ethanolamine phosphate phosphodiesterase Ted1 n=1 Tax=Schizosaccharomyces osmophilus TaxID=2545709 RepID=A0AAE9WJV2_9SCHI|nr:GPI-remodelling mannose-ethanolamine phosphate phosphodiesterase Ted1 [Schizosaccharomyces osmophilus]WBW75278.1 GPI-remodelling mannose-ethanolamine phosphate phosphodiesterase Ted1 [Schizosaccharomyces osmophilus]